MQSPSLHENPRQFLLWFHGTDKKDREREKKKKACRRKWQLIKKSLDAVLVLLAMVSPALFATSEARNCMDDCVPVCMQAEGATAQTCIKARESPLSRASLRETPQASDGNLPVVEREPTVGAWVVACSGCL